MLRCVEVEDVDYLYAIENECDNWEVSGTVAPYSNYILTRFVESQSRDIFSNRELRLIVTTHEGVRCGIIDLFEFDPLNLRAGVGIVIEPQFRGLGYGDDAIETLAQYCRATLHMHQLWCGVTADNRASLKLFAGCGFVECGCRREWIRVESRFVDEIQFQRILQP